MLIGGGEGPWYVASTVTEIYDPDTESFVTAGTMNEERFNPSVTPLGAGRVLVIGGWGMDGPAGARAYHASAEVYDPPRARGKGEPPRSRASGRTRGDRRRREQRRNRLVDRDLRP